MKLKILALFVGVCSLLLTNLSTEAVACHSKRASCCKKSKCKKARKHKRGGLWRKAKKIKLHKAAKAYARFVKSLTKEQKAEFRKLKLEKKRALLPLKARMKLHKVELKVALLAENPDPKDVDAKLNAWAQAKLNYINTKADFFLRARNLLSNDAQKAKFTLAYLKKKKAKKALRRSISRRWKTVKLVALHKLHKSHKRHACKKWKKACAKGCQKSCEKAAHCGGHKACGCKGSCGSKAGGCKCGQPGCAQKAAGSCGGHKAAGSCGGHKAAGCKGSCGGCKGSCGKGRCGKGKCGKCKRGKKFCPKLALLARSAKQKRHFWKRLSPEQKALWKKQKYEQLRTLLPLKAQVKLEKAKWASSLLDLGVKLETLQAHHQAVVNAIVAVKKVKISNMLAFKATLSPEQKLAHGFLLLAKWKKSKKLCAATNKAFHTWQAFVKIKAYRMLRKHRHGKKAACKHSQTQETPAQQQPPAPRK